MLATARDNLRMFFSRELFIIHRQRTLGSMQAIEVTIRNLAWGDASSNIHGSEISFQGSSGSAVMNSVDDENDQPLQQLQRFLSVDCMQT